MRLPCLNSRHWRRPSDAGAAVRSAGAVLLHRLPPRERAALILKEVFDMSLEETAEVLETTVGAVKSALHRGRAKLREDRDSEPPRRASVTAKTEHEQ